MIVDWAMSGELSKQLLAIHLGPHWVVNGIDGSVITRAEFDQLAVAINTGTNLPSVATPNGQAAFLFLLTSALAPLIRLSYGRMVVMAFPYTVVLTAVGLVAVIYTL